MCTINNVISNGVFSLCLCISTVFDPSFVVPNIRFTELFIVFSSKVVEIYLNDDPFIIIDSKFVSVFKKEGP